MPSLFDINYNSGHYGNLREDMQSTDVNGKTHLAPSAPPIQLPVQGRVPVGQPSQIVRSVNLGFTEMPPQFHAIKGTRKEYKKFLGSIREIIIEEDESKSGKQLFWFALNTEMGRITFHCEEPSRGSPMFIYLKNMINVAARENYWFTIYSTEQDRKYGWKVEEISFSILKNLQKPMPIESRNSSVGYPVQFHVPLNYLFKHRFYFVLKTMREFQHFCIDVHAATQLGRKTNFLTQRQLCLEACKEGWMLNIFCKQREDKTDFIRMRYTKTISAVINL